MKTRIGCLVLLAAWAAWGLYLHLTDSFGEEGGGRFAMAGLFGLAVVIVGSGIESRTTRRGRELRGLPIEPERPRNRA